VKHFVSSSAVFFLLLTPLPGRSSEEKVVLCPINAYKISSHFRGAYYRVDGTYVSATNVSEHCREKTAVSKEWRKKIRNSRPRRRERGKEKSIKWSDGEKHLVIESLENLPPVLLSPRVRGIYRMKRSIANLDNPAAGFLGNIVLYDRLFKSPTNITRVLGHEFAHALFYDLTESQRIDYLKISKWIVLKNKSSKKYRFLPNRDYFIEADGKESVDEDFSNNIEYFLFEPHKLRKRNRPIYDWILETYGDKLKWAKGVKR